MAPQDSSHGHPPHRLQLRPLTHSWVSQPLPYCCHPLLGWGSPVLSIQVPTSSHYAVGRNCLLHKGVECLAPLYTTTGGINQCISLGIIYYSGYVHSI